MNTDKELTQETETVEISLEELKAARKEQMIKIVQAELTRSLQQADVVHRQITNAKTETKKKFYVKKLNKIRSGVFQCLQALEMLGVKLDENTQDETNELPANEIESAAV